MTHRDPSAFEVLPATASRAEPAAADAAPHAAPLASAIMRRKILRRAEQRQAERAADPQATFAQATSGGGQQVPYRDEMERSFGQSFSTVQAHLGQAAPMASIQAEAATTGDQVAFATDSPSKELVAHELTHVVQQRQAGAAAGVAAKGEMSEPGDAAEVEADRVAAQVTAGERVAVREAPTAGLHAKRPPGVYYRAGKPLTEDEGRALMARLVSGDATALAALAGPAPDGEPTDGREWGLGLGTDDDERPAAFIIPGGRGGVAWNAFYGKPPEAGGFTDFLAHTHPRIGRDASAVRLSELLDPANKSVGGQRMMILPSSDDLNFAATVGQEHTVYTPYVPIEADGDYDITNAQEATGTATTRLTFHISSLASGMYPAAFKGDPDARRNVCLLSAWCGGKELGRTFARSSERGKNPLMPIAELPADAVETLPMERERVDRRHDDDDDGGGGLEIVDDDSHSGKKKKKKSDDKCCVLQ